MPKFPESLASVKRVHIAIWNVASPKNKKEKVMTNLKPEERAREWIDRKLEDAGWKVINRDEYAPGMSAVAVREAAMRGGLEADYLLLINGKAAAVLEAKREEISLSNPHLIAQAENYTKQVKPWYPTWLLPLPFVYLSNGREIAFKDCRKPKRPSKRASAAQSWF